MTFSNRLRLAALTVLALILISFLGLIVAITYEVYTEWTHLLSR